MSDNKNTEKIAELEQKLSEIIMDNTLKFNIIEYHLSILVDMVERIEKLEKDLRMWKETMVNNTLTSFNHGRVHKRDRKQLLELKEDVYSIKADILNWQVAWVKVSNSYLKFNDRTIENREVLQEFFDKQGYTYYLKKLSGDKSGAKERKDELTSYPLRRNPEVNESVQPESKPEKPISEIKLKPMEKKEPKFISIKDFKKYLDEMDEKPEELIEDKRKRIMHITHCLYCNKKIEVKCRFFPDDPIEVEKEDLEEWITMIRNEIRGLEESWS